MRHSIPLILAIFLILIGCVAPVPPYGNSNRSDLTLAADHSSNTTGATTPFSDILRCNQNGSTLQEREACYDAFIQQQMKARRPADLLAELDQDGTSNSALRLSCHEIAHSIGRNAFLRYNSSIPDAFAQCTQICHSGCYHGVLQGFFRPEPLPGQIYDPHLSAEDLRAKIRDVCHVEGGSRYRFQCLHGLGHAVMYGLDNNLSLSLDICDELTTDYDRQSCYGGAFMENVFSVNPSTRWINRSDPQYPCDRLDERYRYQCYLMQTTVMAEIYGTNIPRIIQACEGAGSYVATCFTSLGRDRSSLFRVQDMGPYNDLHQISPSHRMDYVNGLVYALVDNTWDGRYAFPFCSGLNLAIQREGCYQSAIRYMSLNLGLNRSVAHDSCHKDAPENDRTMCLGISG